MKRVIKLFLFVLFLFILSINKAYAIAPQNGVGGYFKEGTNQTGACSAYPNIKVNINNITSESGAQYAFCVEKDEEYLGPWHTGTGANYSACGDYSYLADDCATVAAAYIGVTEGGTNFWAAQTLLNGRYFYTSSSCTSSSRISTTEILQRGQAYCNDKPTLERRTITEGEDVTLYLPEVSDYTPVSYVNGLSVSILEVVQFSSKKV